MTSIISYIIIIITTIISIALLTLIERKVIGSSQRRLGPETTGYGGILQPIADGLKLIMKQMITPIKGNISLFYFSAIISFLISILIWSVLPVTTEIYDMNHNILIILALSSISIYGILLSGWSSKCMYTILGSIRSSSQLISYELSVTLLLISLLLGEGLDIEVLSENQRSGWNIVTNYPIAIPYLITILAETNRAPFDLSEAESELVSGFNTEHSALPFAYFFLAEYGFIISQSYLIVYLFLGGSYLGSLEIPVLLEPYVLSLKAFVIVTLIVIIRATTPRLRYDLLQNLAWNIILPLSIGYLILTLTII